MVENLIQGKNGKTIHVSVTAVTYNEIYQRLHQSVLLGKQIH